MRTLYRRIRPVTVRFTEPGLADYETQLVAEVLVERSYPGRREPAATQHGLSAKARGKQRATDADQIQSGHPRYEDADDAYLSDSTIAPNRPEARHPTSHGQRHKRRTTTRILRKSEETASAFRHRIRTEHLPAELRRRSLRLIHAGRVLKEDGIKLVHWLDSLEAKRAQGQGHGTGGAASDGTVAAAAERRAHAGEEHWWASPDDRLDELDSDEGGSEGREDDEDEDEPLLLRQLEIQGQRAGQVASQVKGWVENRILQQPQQSQQQDDGALLPLFSPSSTSGEPKRKDILFDSDDIEEQEAAASSRRPEPSQTFNGESETRIVESLADRVYIQCAVGAEDLPDSLLTDGRASERSTDYLGPATPRSNATLFSLGDDGDDDDEDAQPTTAGTTESTVSTPLTGFDRLRETAGLDEEDIRAMRAHFRRARQAQLERSGDVLRREEEDEHARALEEQWIDGMVGGTAAQQERDAAGTAGGASGQEEKPAWTVWVGMMIGFYFPVVSGSVLSCGYVQEVGLAWGTDATRLLLKLPFLFLSDRPHPSYFPSIHPLPRFSDSDSEGEDDDDDEIALADPQAPATQERRSRAAARSALRGSSVFSRGMQNAILMGIIAK